MSPTPSKVSKGWDAALNRICTYVLLKDKHSNKQFWVFNTHLDHMGEIARTKSLELIIATIDALNINNYPVIFMGDFNSEPYTERIKQLKTKMNDTRLVSIQKPFGPEGTFNNFKHNEPISHLIDYIFISKNFNCIVNKYAVLTDAINLKYPSDHCPVYVDVIFK